MGTKLPEGFYRDKDLLKKARADHGGSLQGVSNATGVPRKTLSDWWHRFDLGTFHPQRLADAGGFAFDEPSELEEAVLNALKRGGDRLSLIELADACDVAPKRVQEVVDSLREAKGYRIDQDLDEQDNVVQLTRVIKETDHRHAAQALFDGDTVRFAVISDVHLGSKHAMEDELHIAYEQVKAEGIDTVYNPGDLVCGVGIYPGQINDIRFHTLEDQIEYAAAVYPSVDGITTRIIGGNHDLEGQFGRIGANPVRAVCNQRDDMIYDGDYHATYEFPNGSTMYMVHPKGGGSYARSYKMQKFAEAFDMGSKPNVLLAGHYHDMIYMQERGIQMLKAGCFEANGMLGVRVPLRAPQTGFWIIQMTLADDASVVRFDPSWRPFYPGRQATTSVVI